MSDGYLPDPIWRDRLPKMWAWMRNFQVNGAAGFSNSEDNISISIPPPQKPSFSPPEDNNPIVVLRIGSAYTGKGLFAATLCVPPSSDINLSADLSTQLTTVFANGTSGAVIACDLYAATAGNSAALVSPIAADELCLGMYWSTQSNGTDVYVITGRFRMINGSNYMVPLFNAGQWTTDWPRAH